MSDGGSRPIREISTAMEGLIDNDDWEVRHIKADELLLEAIDRLSAYATDTQDEGELPRLAEAYNRLEMWYA